jgi:hypothetical protein
MNIINKILILIILIFLINHLSDGQIIKIIKNTFCTCKTKVDHFIGLTNNASTDNPNVIVPSIPYQTQKDFPYNNNNDTLDDDTYDLYKFLNNLITVNVNMYELTQDNSNRLKVSDIFKKEIYDELNKIFNCGEYSFNDITFLSELYYYNNNTGKTIEPFEFKSNIAYKNKTIGSIVIYIECFMRKDKFYYQPNQTGYLTIQSIKLINRTYSDGKTKEKIWRSAYKLIPTKNEDSIIEEKVFQYQNENENENVESESLKHINNKNENQAIKQNIELSNKMVESFNNHFVNRENYDDLFIKPASQNQDNLQTDTENSLIPSNIEFSTCM